MPKLNRAEDQRNRVEVNQDGDQEEIVQKALDAVRDNKSQVLAEAFEQLQATRSNALRLQFVLRLMPSRLKTTRGCEGRVLIAPLQ